ncbi:hypothetical protein ACFPOB_20470 [Bosea eneae]|uniref:Chemotaxis protein n=1 Tax=Bosea eneae TaxID=151454 RepID=A0ABW0IXF4_9HYPH
MDITGLSSFLLGNGPWGAVVLYLLWDRHQLIQRLDASQKSFTTDLLRIIEEVTKAVSASTEAMRSNTAVQERAADSARAVAEAVKLMQAAIDGLEKDVERLDRGGG